MDYCSTPIQEITHPTLVAAGVRLLVKREDRNHYAVSGNKWWKLKYNIEEALWERKSTILTFGGAYSNHIYATAAVAQECGLKSIGIIRGEETFPANATLSFARQQGMAIHYVSREAYRSKANPSFIENLRARFGDFFLIPEGGTNQLAIKGCAEFAERVLSPVAFDYLMLPVGTGGTIAGLVCGFRGDRKIIGVPVLKDADFLIDDIGELIITFSATAYGNWSLLTSYHHGGYAKTTKMLLEFVDAMNDLYNLPLDTVYTGKLLWAVIKEAEAGKFERGSTVLALHTGGLQGRSVIG